MTLLRPARILALAGIWLALLMGGCAHADFWASMPEDQFPDPSASVYQREILKARAERIRAVERWERSLEGLNRLIEFRRDARVSRDSSGNIIGISDGTNLQQWRLEMERELLKARGARSRLERKVKADFQGKFPPWWPQDDG